jgi:hypothetical protein
MTSTHLSQPGLARRIAVRVVFGALTMLLSGILTIVGLAPENIVDRFIGKERVVFWLQALLGASPETWRWSCVISGDLLFGLAVLIWIGIPLILLRAKMERENAEMENKHAELRAKLEASDAQMNREHSMLHDDFIKAERSERTARRLHQRTRQMLEEMRRMRGEVPRI